MSTPKQCVYREPKLDADGQVVREFGEIVWIKCTNSPRTRGQCHQHYQTSRSYIRDGKATEADLMRRRLMMPKGTGGATMIGHEAFLLGDKSRGAAKK